MKTLFITSVAKKAVVVLTILMACVYIAQAQTNKEELDLVQEIIGMEKKAAMAGFVNLDEKSAFWPVYDAYELERKELGKARLNLLEKYANNYQDITDDVTADLIKQMQTQKKGLDKLIDKYYKKIKKASGTKVAAQFYQFENYILSSIRLEILEDIPFIGEFD